MIKFIKKLAIVLVISGGVLSQQVVAETSKSKEKATIKSSQSETDHQVEHYIRGASRTGLKAELFFRGKGQSLSARS